MAVSNEQLRAEVQKLLQDIDVKTFTIGVLWDWQSVGIMLEDHRSVSVFWSHIHFFENVGVYNLLIHVDSICGFGPIRPMSGHQNHGHPFFKIQKKQQQVGNIENLKKKIWSPKKTSKQTSNSWKNKKTSFRTSPFAPQLDTNLFREVARLCGEQFGFDSWSAGREEGASKLEVMWAIYVVVYFWYVFFLSLLHIANCFFFEFSLIYKHC